MFAGFKDLLRVIEGNELASEEDFKIPHCVNTIEEALALIRETLDLGPDDVLVPFSFSTPWKAWVVIPEEFLSDLQKTRISIFHELQHHRQLDTTWQYGLFLLRAIAGINPLMSIFSKIISETQEIKVDSTLVDEGKVRASDYAQCLLDVATNARVGQKPLVCATGLAFLTDRQSLTRRIESMFQLQKSRAWSASVIAVALIVFMSALAFKTGQAIGSAGLTMAEAKSLLANTPTTFPLEMNQDVLYHSSVRFEPITG